MGTQKTENHNRSCWLYSSECPTGMIFHGAEAIADAKKKGWVDSPTKIKPKKGGKSKGATNDGEDS